MCQYGTHACRCWRCVRTLRRHAFPPHPTPPPAASPSRLPASPGCSYAFSAWFPLRVALKKELGELLVGMGLVGSALALFEQLELWDSLIVCYQLLDKRVQVRAGGGVWGRRVWVCCGMCCGMGWVGGWWLGACIAGDCFVWQLVARLPPVATLHLVAARLPKAESGG